MQRLAQAPDPQPASGKRGRGRLTYYPDRLFSMATLVMLVKDVHTSNGLFTILHEPTAKMQSVRYLLHFGSDFPSQRTWGRGMASIVEQLPA